MSSWPESDAVKLTCSILTHAAEGPATQVHDRMPVILPQSAHSTWLDPEKTDAGRVLGIALEISETQVEFYPVSQRVNYSKNEGRELMVPFRNPA